MHNAQHHSVHCDVCRQRIPHAHTYTDAAGTRKGVYKVAAAAVCTRPTNAYLPTMKCGSSAARRECGFDSCACLRERVQFVVLFVFTSAPCLHKQCNITSGERSAADSSVRSAIVVVWAVVCVSPILYLAERTRAREIRAHYAILGHSTAINRGWPCRVEASKQQSIDFYIYGIRRFASVRA